MNPRTGDTQICSLHNYKDNKPRGTKLSRGEHTRMPRFYRNFVTKSLGDIIDEALAHPAHEQYALNEELALMRDVAGQSVALYGCAKDKYAESLASGNEKEREKFAAFVVNAGELMKAQLMEVCKLADTAAKIQKDRDQKDSVPMSVVLGIIAQMNVCARKHFGDTPEGMREAQRFKELFESEIRIPVQGDTPGTFLTPDQDAQQMDDTVPTKNLTVVDIPLVDGSNNGHASDNTKAG